MKNNLLLKSIRISQMLALKVSFSTRFQTPSKASLIAIQETLVSFGRFCSLLN